MATGISLRDATESTGQVQLAYDGKRYESDILNGEPARPALILGTEGPNRLYYGENLRTLLHLLDSPLAGKIRCVYIDPPFASKKTYLDRNAKHAYHDGLSGSGYVEFLRQRLIVLRELLAEDGSIFVHLDQTMVFEIKLILDEVFGRENFRNFITRKKCSIKNYTRKTFGNIADHLLYYSKGSKPVWNRIYDPWDEKSMRREYPCVDPQTGRRFKKVPLHAPNIRNGETGQPWRGMAPPPGKHWQYRPSRLEEMDANGEIYWSPTGNPRRKVYFDQSEGIPAQDIWMKFRDPYNQNVRITGYPTEKNHQLVLRCIQACSNESDIVLDAFAGSGTSLEAAHELGRRFIGIDREPAAIRAAVKRLRNGREKMGDFVSAAQDAPLFEMHGQIPFGLHAEKIEPAFESELAGYWTPSEAPLEVCSPA